jgi:hypothetical protein
LAKAPGNHESFRGRGVGDHRKSRFLIIENRGEADAPAEP